MALVHAAAFTTPRPWSEAEIADLLASPLCFALTEPGAGSDANAIKTRAVRDGDDWLITGQKIWSSNAQFAEYGFLLARSNPDVVKQAGITAFLVPLDAPGVAPVAAVRQPWLVLREAVTGWPTTVILGVEARMAKTDAVQLVTILGAMGALAHLYLDREKPFGTGRVPLVRIRVPWTAKGALGP